MPTNPVHLRSVAIGLLVSAVAVSAIGDGKAEPVLDPADAQATTSFTLNAVAPTVYDLTFVAESTTGLQSTTVFISEPVDGYQMWVENDETYVFGVDAMFISPDDDPILYPDTEHDDTVVFPTYLSDGVTLHPRNDLPYDHITSSLSIQHNIGHLIDAGADTPPAPDHIEEFTYDLAQVDGIIEVTGGEIEQLRVWASSTVNVDGVDEQYQAYYQEFNDPNATNGLPDADGFALLMVPADQVILWGQVDIRLHGGDTIVQNLGAQQVDLLLPGGDPHHLTATWPVINAEAPTTTMSIQGSTSASLPTGVVFNFVRHWIVATGILGETTEGMSRRDYVFTPDGLYEISNLIAGPYQLFAQTTFENPHAVLRRPDEPVEVFDGPNLPHPYGQTLGAIEASVVADGFYSVDEMSFLRLYAYGDPASGQGLAEADFIGNTVTIPASTGSWIPHQYYARISGGGGPNAHVQGWDYDRLPVSVTGGVTTTEIADFSLTTARTSVTLYVGPGQMLRDAYISGGLVEGGMERRFSAEGPTTSDVAPRIDIVAEPGTYMVQASAVLEGVHPTLIEWPPFEMVIEPGLPPDDQGVVNLSSASIDFLGNLVDENSQALTTVTATPIGPPIDEGFQLFDTGGGGGLVYYDIYSEAEFTGQIEVCLAIPAGVDQNLVSLRHWDTCEGGDPSWCDLSGTPIQVGSEWRICGFTPSLSPFALVVRIDGDEDGVDYDFDNCPSVANPSQRDLDDDGLGDECDDDDDDDGLLDIEDNCPQDVNPEQKDCDSDGIGGVCDDDDDDDGVLDEDDNCPKNANPGQSDFDGDGIGDACDYV